MSEERKYEVTLYKFKDGKEYSDLIAYVQGDGQLVMEGYDLGPSVKNLQGDSDYEYWIYVKPDDVPKVVLELIKDRFNSFSAFKDWLREKGIDYDFRFWI